MEKLQREVHSVTGVQLTSKQLSCLERYEQELMEWNAQFNLTAIRDTDGIRSKHFLDSLSCTLAWGEKTPTKLIDVGTGAGFPGIPLKIIYPGLQLTLVESVGKKAEFCKFLVNKLKLETVDIIQTRAEEIGQQTAYREKFDWAVARAVANLSTLVEYLLPLVHIGGAILAQKGESGPAEAHKAERAIKLLGGRIRQVRQLCLPGIVEERYLIIIDKVAATPPQYPRRVGIPTRKPLD